jgi:hypothetical protein
MQKKGVRWMSEPRVVGINVSLAVTHHNIRMSTVPDLARLDRHVTVARDNSVAPPLVIDHSHVERAVSFLERGKRDQWLRLARAH